MLLFFFFQAEDGIRDRSPSRGLGDVYKRQALSNRNEIINGLDIRGATIKDLAIFILLTGAVYAVASDYLGFPVVGALTTAVSSSIFFRWTMTALEGEPV